MGKLETSVEWLRHFVDTNVFDYCVVWKLGDDPSRFIEWMNCCCGGGFNVKAEPEVAKNLISSPCRDVHFRHMRRSKACEALASLPDSIPLYSGIQGDVVISNQPRWICSANSNESTGTQVLIPVQGGLIEFYSEKHIPMDQEIVDFVMLQFSFNSEQESMTIQSSPSFDKIEFLPHHSLEGSSTVTTPSNEISSLASVIDPKSALLPAKQLVGKDYGSNNNSPMRQKAVFSPGCEKSVAQKENGKLINMPDGQKHRSKNNEMERARRIRIRDGLYTLRALVPNISKMDKTSILGDAIQYIEELQTKVNDLKGELLKELDDDNAEDHKQVSSGDIAEKKEQIKMEMQVNQVGTRYVLLKFIYAHEQAGFMRLMQAIDSLGLQVVDANVTTFDGMDLNILVVLANKEIQMKQLRESLMKGLCL